PLRDRLNARPFQRHPPADYRQIHALVGNSTNRRFGRNRYSTERSGASAVLEKRLLVWWLKRWLKPWLPARERARLGARELARLFGWLGGARGAGGASRGRGVGWSRG